MHVHVLDVVLYHVAGPQNCTCTYWMLYCIMLLILRDARARAGCCIVSCCRPSELHVHVLDVVSYHVAGPQSCTCTCWMMPCWLRDSTRNAAPTAIPTWPSISAESKKSIYLIYKNYERLSCFTMKRWSPLIAKFCGVECLCWFFVQKFFSWNILIHHLVF